MITADMSRSFPIIVSGFQAATGETARPDIESVEEEAGVMLSGAMIVYLFAVWDQYFEHKDVPKYFLDEEQRVFYAYKHIRHVFAHNTRGDRHGNKPNLDRMAHADKLDDALADGLLPSVSATEDKIDLEFPGAFLDCQNFMADMARKLAAGRISVGGSTGKVRTADGGEADVI